MQVRGFLEADGVGFSAALAGMLMLTPVAGNCGRGVDFTPICGNGLICRVLVVLRTSVDPKWILFSVSVGNCSFGRGNVTPGRLFVKNGTGPEPTG